MGDLPMEKNKAPKKYYQPQCTRVYEYVPDLDLKLSLGEGSYIRVNSRKHRDDQLKLLMAEAKKKPTPEDIEEKRKTREFRIKKRMADRMRARGKEKVVLVAVKEEAVVETSNVVEEPVVENLNVVEESVVENLNAVDENLNVVEESVAVNPNVVEEPVVENPNVVVDMENEMLENAAANLAARAIATASQSAAYFAALLKVKKHQIMHAQVNAPPPAVDAPPTYQTGVQPWFEQIKSEPVLSLAIASASSQPNLAINNAMNQALETNKSVPISIPNSARKGANKRIMNETESSKARELAAKKVKFFEKAKKMPAVKIQGEGPNYGREIEGSLMKWMDGEIIIACHCHAHFFNPVEFVKHAGHVDVSDPMRLITVFFPPTISL